MGHRSGAESGPMRPTGTHAAIIEWPAAPFQAEQGYVGRRQCGRREGGGRPGRRRPGPRQPFNGLGRTGCSAVQGS
eukprot:768038-Hanusia_phi.AAC.4